MLYRNEKGTLSVIQRETQCPVVEEGLARISLSTAPHKSATANTHLEFQYQGVTDMGFRS